jgi:hypothetical protein
MASIFFRVVFLFLCGCGFAIIFPTPTESFEKSFVFVLGFVSVAVLVGQASCFPTGMLDSMYRRWDECGKVCWWLVCLLTRACDYSEKDKVLKNTTC